MQSRGIARVEDDDCGANREPVEISKRRIGRRIDRRIDRAELDAGLNMDAKLDAGLDAELDADLGAKLNAPDGLQMAGFPEVQEQGHYEI